MKDLSFEYDSALHSEKHCELLNELVRHQSSTPDTFEREPILTGFRFLTCELARALAKIAELERRHESFIESVNERLNK